MIQLSDFITIFGASLASLVFLFYIIFSFSFYLVLRKSYFCCKVLFQITVQYLLCSSKCCFTLKFFFVPIFSNSNGVCSKINEHKKEEKNFKKKKSFLGKIFLILSFLLFVLDTLYKNELSLLPRLFCAVMT
jgi:hypothetical protein